MMLVAAIVALALAFFISILATPLAGRVAYRFGMIDTPQRHKAHAKPTPLLGGCAIFAAVLGPSLLALALVRVWAHDGVPSWMPQAMAQHIPGAASKAPMAIIVLFGAFALHVMGIIDDRRNLGPWLKLALQVAICSAVVIFTGIADPNAGGVRVLTALDRFMSGGKTISIIISIIWLVGVTNAFNFLDNTDGLSAGVAAICAAALLGASASIGQIFVSAWLCLLLGALAGFLVYNFPPAKIFMGDGGALVIGYMMAVLTCLTTYAPPGTFHLYYVVAPLVLLAVPLYDMAGVIYLRVRERRNPMVGDRRHFSHRLMRRGMSTRAVVGTIYCCTIATAIAASLLPHADAVGAALVIAQTIAILVVIAMLEGADRP